MKIPTSAQLKKEDFSLLLEKEYTENLGKRRLYFFSKRLLDIIGSLLALAVFSPAWLLLIVLIRLDSEGSAIFYHKRVGKNSRLFTLYKFRTMHKGVKQEEFAPVSLKDPRITRVGKFLRRTSLDEVPQFWNVLRGEMSLVGPRPEMQFIVNEYTRLQKARLLVKPGITGLWQIAGRKDLPLRDNVEYDLHYIRHMSLLMDLHIMFKTITVIFSGKGAY